MVKISKPTKDEIFVIDRVGNKKSKKVLDESTNGGIVCQTDMAESAAVTKQKAVKKKSSKNENDKPSKQEIQEIVVDDDEKPDDEQADNSEQKKKAGKRSKKGDKEAATDDSKKNVGTKRGTEAGRLDEATLPYVREVSALAKADDFETDEDRSIFVDNVWRELKMRNSEQLVRLITHKEGSIAVQSLLKMSTPRQLYRIIRGLKGVMPRVIFNPYGSHILEALFGFVPRLVNASMDDFKRAEEEEQEEADGAEEDLDSLEKLFQDT
jgi:nucleolar protein 9